MSLKSYRVADLSNKLEQVGFTPLDILLVGATGVGKSSTINSLFGEYISEVGQGVEPETMGITYYSLNEKIRFWDSPGLGDSISKDEEHSKKLIDILYKTYRHNDGTWGFIDLVLVVLDGSQRDLGTTYDLLEKVILKNIQSDRVMIVINQADMAMKGREWLNTHNKPSSKLLDYLNEKSLSIQNRIKSSLGLNVKLPIYYSAEKKYNLEELLDFIIAHFPKGKRNILNNHA